MTAWDEKSGTVTGNAQPMTGSFSVADPRHPEGADQYGQYGVRRWEEPTGAVINVKSPGQGPHSVADLRPGFGASTHHNVYRIVQWGEQAGTITGANHPAGGAGCVADPRCQWSANAHTSKLRVIPYDQPATTITGSASSSHGFTSGAMSVADPRPAAFKDGRNSFVGGGHYGVTGWAETSGAVTGSALHDNGSWSVADPREAEGEPLNSLPEPNTQLVAVIRALDGTWHRPFTTLELAALQSLWTLIARP